MRNAISVVGVDLASKSWRANGSARLTFDGNTGAWLGAEANAVPWPDSALSARAMAATLDRYMLETGSSGLSIDGPQGWRSPDAGARRGVGRVCEFDARTPGKTGALGVVYPRSYASWVTFSIEVYGELLRRGHAVLANDPGQSRLPVGAAGTYWLLECSPSSTWVTSGLLKLPGHRKAPPDVGRAFSVRLCARFGLPFEALTDHHDHLQAVVSALPAAALLGGPCRAVPRGVPACLARSIAGDELHSVEGLIWDAAPRGA